MRRIVLGLVATAIATTLLIGLKSTAAVSRLGLSAAAPADPAGDEETGSGEPGPGQPDPSLLQPTGTPAGTSTSPAGAPVTAGATATAGPAGAPKPPPASTTAVPPASRTILGPAVATVWKSDNYGKMQVKIVVTGTHIDDIVTVQQSNRPKTVSTTLRAQALSAQSANVGNVSGATASSNAYKQSLQAAIASI